METGAEGKTVGTFPPQKKIKIKRGLVFFFFFFSSPPSSRGLGEGKK